MSKQNAVPLLVQLARAFEGTTRSRGTDYYRQRRVRINLVTDAAILASVRGTAQYEVALERHGRKIRASCTCPYFEVDFCKHIWAVFVAVSEQQLWPGVDGEGRMELVRGLTEEEQLDADLAEAGFEDDRGDYSEDSPVDSSEDDDSSPRRSPAKAPRVKPVAQWRSRLAELHSAATSGRQPASESWPSQRELLYVIDVPQTLAGGALSLEVCSRDLKKDGTWGKPKSKYIRREFLRQLPDARDREVLALLVGATPTYDYGGYGSADYADFSAAGSYESSVPFRYRLVDLQPELLLPLLCQTGRCRLRLQLGDAPEQWLPIAWEGGEPWQLQLEVRSPEPAKLESHGGRENHAGHEIHTSHERQASNRRHAGRESHSAASPQYEVLGALSRGAERMDLSTPVLLLDSGIFFTREHAMRYDHRGVFAWIRSLRARGALLIPIAERDDFVAELWRQPQLPPIQLPAELRYEEVTAAPRARLVLRREKAAAWRDVLTCELSFDYDGAIVPQAEPCCGITQSDRRRVLLRDRSAEDAAVARLHELGARWTAPGWPDRGRKLELPSARLQNAVRELIALGWNIEAEGKIYRSPGKFEMQVQSGVDWFELHGAVEFGDTVAHLPELLAALRRGEDLVRLDDGTFGLLPQEWLKRYGAIAGLGTAHEDHLRFARTQVGLLDALLVAQPEVRCDETFNRARGALRGFAGVEAAEPPAGFQGELRPYQKTGLGWLAFLRQFGFGGCLADDMGLGKTIQVLALLEGRRELREQQRARAGKRPRNGGKRNIDASPEASIGPSLVVVPKSLVFNWKQEAARFVPRLRVLDHTGTAREKGSAHFEHCDVVLTTYGTLRNDIEDIRGVRFDYLILDEAQAIKNAASASAKVARLLQGEHRLALSGTPVENHLGELWSLFEFLNPGMLGAASVFKLAQSSGRNPDEETRKLLANALRPFLLRRTKEQVAPELPQKLEQTLYCELESKQRKLYDELRDHYRKVLLDRVQRGGIGRAKIQILEALLRLRQAAIHPALIDPRKGDAGSAKLDMLLFRLKELVDEGHKTLVFSQFTGMLAILREHLSRDGILHEYLDGKTRDRQSCVERFQRDPECRLFLISLKAGGVGLNLTAAQYVFVLDPWWNPAVEAQAIDRAHRIGQSQRVFAYRLIARNTVEEKVLELQNTKRELADAILGEDNALIRDLAREDLELLLS